MVRVKQSFPVDNETFKPTTDMKPTRVKTRKIENRTVLPLLTCDICGKRNERIFGTSSLKIASDMDSFLGTNLVSLLENRLHPVMFCLSHKIEYKWRSEERLKTVTEQELLKEWSEKMEALFQKRVPKIGQKKSEFGIRDLLSSPSTSKTIVNRTGAAEPLRKKLDWGIIDLLDAQSASENSMELDGWDSMHLNSGIPKQEIKDEVVNYFEDSIEKGHQSIDTKDMTVDRYVKDEVINVEQLIGQPQSIIDPGLDSLQTVDSQIILKEEIKEEF